jgi:hypothetical protein
MAKLEISSHDARESVEAAKLTDQHKLDDATYEPRAVVERTGDYKQSEAIQASFTAVVNNAAAASHADHNSAKASGQGSGSEGPSIKGNEGRDTVGGQGSDIRQDLSHVHLNSEMYYTNETGSGPHPHTFGEDRERQRKEEEEKEKEERGPSRGIPNVGDLGPSSYLDGDGSSSTHSLVQHMTGIKPPPPPPPHGLGDGGTGDEDAAHERESMTSLNEQKEARIGPDKYPDGYTDNAPDDSIMAVAPDRDTVRGQQPQPVNGIFEKSGNEAEGNGKENITPINLPGVRRDMTTPASGPFEKSSGGASGEGQENITPINLPNVHDIGIVGSAPLKQAADSGTPGKIDPDTGQVKPPTGGSNPNSNNDTNESEAGPSASLGAVTTNLNIKGITEDSPPRFERPENRDGAVSMLPEVHVSDKPPALASSNRQDAAYRGAFGPQELNDRFAEQALNAIGMGANGFIANKSAGTSGTAHGYGPGAPEGKMPGLGNSEADQNKGFGSSGGGAPVHGYGPGSKGEDAPGMEFYYYPADDSNGTGEKIIKGGYEQTGATCETNVNAKTGTKEVVCQDKNGIYIMTFGYLVEGGNSMPYTGSWSGGAFHPKDPGTIGGAGPENDSGKFMPVIRNSGLGYQGGGRNSTDEPSKWDDGNWYGGIFGGGGNNLSDNQVLIDPIGPARR